MAQHPDTELLRLMATAVDPAAGAEPRLVDSLLESTPAAPLSRKQVRRILVGAGVSAIAAGTLSVGGKLAATSAKSAWMVKTAAAVGLALGVFAVSMGLLVVLKGKRPQPPDGMTAYPIAAPGPAYVSSPTPVYDVPNYDPSLNSPAEFHAPPGCSNLAARRTVTASAVPLRGTLSTVTDGLKEAPDIQGVVELPPRPQWVQIDLGDVSSVYDILIWHRFDSPAVYQDVVVQISSDPDFSAAGTETLFNNDFDNTLGFGRGTDANYLETNRGRLISAGGQAARYIRLWSNGRYLDDHNDYVEVEVWGKRRGL